MRKHIVVDHFGIESRIQGTELGTNRHAQRILRQRADACQQDQHADKQTQNLFHLRTSNILSSAGM